MHEKAIALVFISAQHFSTCGIARTTKRFFLTGFHGQIQVVHVNDVSID